ncbi:MAG TPA: hypothetical protein VFD32_16395 [Dehalococcoidia bacterium]|nr:hypothetical protein [Dehalococcoidia bacterium]
MPIFSRFSRAGRRRAGLAALAVALSFAGGHAARRANAQAIQYLGTPIRVTFNSISFPKLNDCNWLESNCNTADLYGEVTAVSNGGSSGGRKLAGDEASCEHAWEDPFADQCYRLVHQGEVKLFQGTPLCTMPTAFYTDWGHCQQLNNSFVVYAHPGETLTVSANLWDDDQASFDDKVCVTSLKLPISQASLVSGATGSYVMGQGFNGYGSCSVTFTLHTL